MSDFMTTIGLMMDEFVSAHDTLHPRAKVAILGVAATALKLSAFKLENEKELLLQWLPSACGQGKTICISTPHSKSFPSFVFSAQFLLQALLPAFVQLSSRSSRNKCWQFQCKCITLETCHLNLRCLVRVIDQQQKLTNLLL